MFTVKEILKATNSKLIKGSLGEVVSGVSIDSRTIRPKELFIAIKGANFDGHNFINDAIKKKAGGIIFSDDSVDNLNLDVPLIKVNSTIRMLTGLASYHRSKFSIPVIAITGSNGKTTTKELISHFLSNKFRVLKNEGNQNNQIGLSLNLFKLKPQHQVCVMELGTNNFGEIECLSKILKPNIGVITNIGPSHLEGLKDLAGVFREKISLLDNLIEPKAALVNADDSLLRNFLRNKPKKVFSFGYKKAADFRMRNLKFKNDKLTFEINKKFSLNTTAKHNAYNCLAAVAISRLFGLTYKELTNALLDFNWLEGRFKRHIKGNIHLIDDSYNANPFSFASALESLEGYNKKSKKILVMADMLELGNFAEKYHSDLAKKISGLPLDLFIGLGNYSKSVVGFVRKNSKIEAHHLNGTDEILKILKLKLDSKPTTILVKGSHFFKLENVILHLLSST